MRKINAKYFEWLYGKIKGETRDYLKLCVHLHSIPFRWDVPNDGNREQDAIRQREQFAETEAYDFPSEDIDRLYDEPVSVFEVLVALCERIDFMLDDMVHNSRLNKWFEELLRNIGLAWCVDEEMEYRLGAVGEVENAIGRLLDRRYGWNGNGSLFPLLKRPKQSMAKTEIWYQMMAYLNENY